MDDVTTKLEGDARGLLQYLYTLPPGTRVVLDVGASMAWEGDLKSADYSPDNGVVYLGFE